MEGEEGKDQCFRYSRELVPGEQATHAPALWAHHVEKPGILAILSTTSNTLL